MGLKIINICQPFLLARIPSQNAFAIGCKRSPRTVEIRRTVGERLRMFSFIERRAGFRKFSFQGLEKFIATGFSQLTIATPIIMNESIHRLGEMITCNFYLNSLPNSEPLDVQIERIRRG